MKYKIRNKVLDCNNAYKQRNGNINAMKKGILLFSLIIFALGILIISGVFALTASIDKPKMVLYKNITGDKLVFKESVIVNNVNAYPIGISIVPTGDWRNRVTIEENNFTIEENTSREVFYDVTIEKAGEFAGDIIVTFNDNTQTVGSLAQRLVVHVTKAGNKNSSSLLIIFSIIIIVIAVVILILVSKKSGKAKVSGSITKGIGSKK